MRRFTCRCPCGLEFELGFYRKLYVAGWDCFECFPDFERIKEVIDDVKGCSCSICKQCRKAIEANIRA